MTLALGYPHPDYLLPLLTGKQFNDWTDYFNLEPWGCDLEDRRALFVATSARACMSEASIDAEDYFPHWEAGRREPTPEEVVQLWQAIAVAWG